MPTPEQTIRWLNAGMEAGWEHRTNAMTWRAADVDRIDPSGLPLRDDDPGPEDA
ncbi:MAG TPA: hypothetical protein VKZ89_20165 [Thermobifida alba]|nr:hypothetical protein [Thermobifida alba]